MLTQIELRVRMTYDPDNGEFTWLPTGNPKWDSRFSGKPVGTFVKTHSGKTYRKVRMAGINHYMHRLAWLYVNGIEPLQIDHINGNGCDNRLVNLREVSPEMNSKNMRLHSRNTSGVAGVHIHPCGRWQARIQLNGKTVSLGLFVKLEDAIYARRSMEQSAGYHSNHGIARPL